MQIRRKKGEKSKITPQYLNDFGLFIVEENVVSLVV